MNLNDLPERERERERERGDYPCTTLVASIDTWFCY